MVYLYSFAKYMDYISVNFEIGIQMETDEFLSFIYLFTVKFGVLKLAIDRLYTIIFGSSQYQILK